MVIEDWADLVLAYGDPALPDWVALETDTRQVTIKELADLMMRAAGTLGRGSGVVVVSDPDPILHTLGLLASVAAGRPAITVDRKQPESTLHSVAGRAGATTSIGRPVEGLDNLDFGTLVDGPPAPRRRFDPSSVGSIFLTSGSTGQPKLVERSRRADLNAAMCMRLAEFPIEPGDRHWLAVPHSQAPFLTLVMGSMFAGATTVFAPFEAARVDEFIRDRRISSCYLVPTMLRLAREQDGLSGAGWDSLRALMTGGERLDENTSSVLLSNFSDRIYNGYGMTEVPRVCEARPQDIRDRPGSVGRPTRMRQAIVVAIGTDDPLPIGEEGEILVRGPDMYDRYLGGEPRPEWHRTGDVGVIDEQGFVFINGRSSAVVQVGGNRVSTEEVANELREHPDIAQAAVIAVADETWTNRLEAFVVPESVDTDSVEAWLRDRSAAYKVPRKFHVLSELPVDSSGKLSMQTLHGIAADPSFVRQ